MMNRDVTEVVTCCLTHEPDVGTECRLSDGR